MLKILSVKNFGVIKNVFLEFEDGLNIITGETGAGKSILIGAIKLLLGDRFNKSLIRDESLPVKIEAIFEDSFDFLDDELRSEFDIDDELIVKRIIDISGKNKISINGNLATLAQLKNIVAEMIDIHGQHENQKLLNPKYHLEYIDKLLNTNKLNEYKELYQDFTSLKNSYHQLKEKVSETLKNKDFIQFQINEIEELNIKLPDDLEIEDKLSYLTNIEKINENLTLSLNYLKDGEISAYTLISDALKHITTTTKYLEKIKNTEEKLDSLLYNLDEIANEIYSYLEFDEFDPNLLNELNNRKYKLDNLKNKYNMSLEEILDYKEKLKEQIENIEVDEDEIFQLKNKLDEYTLKLKELGNEINLERKEIATELCQNIEKILDELELKNSKLDFDLKILNEINNNAFAEGEFLISTNLGFKPSSLAKIASGGEISRVMLALKEVFAKSDNIATLIFDEIDTGISGKTAKKVAEKLKKLSQYKQLIVITHLPVVAAAADNHFHILKSTVNNCTTTIVKKLDIKSKKEVLASMISGEVTEMSKKQAEELING